MTIAHPTPIPFIFNTTPTKPWLSIGSIQDLAPPLWVYFIWGMGLEPSKGNMYPGTIPKSIPSHPTPSYLSPCLSVCLSIQSNLILPLTYFISLSTYLQIHLSAYLSDYLSIHPSIHPFVFPFLSLPIGTLETGCVA